LPLQLYYFLGLTAIFILMSWTIYLPYRVRQLYFLPVACMSAAAYFGAIATQQWGWPFALVLIAGIALGALLAFIPALLIGGSPLFAVVIVSLTFIFIVKTVIENVGILGRTTGIFGIPPVEHLLLITYTLLIIVGFFIYRFEHSSLGRAAGVVFVDKDVAATLGINIKGLGMLLQTVAGAIGGMTGVIYAFLIGSLFPDFFAFAMVGTLITMFFVGGYSNMWGVIVSAPALWGIPLLLPSVVHPWRQVIYAVLLVVIVLVRPEGLITRRTVRNVANKGRAWLSRLTGIRK
jgi:branched-chain amino acid transport system permease protein